MLQIFLTASSWVGVGGVGWGAGCERWIVAPRFWVWQCVSQGKTLRKGCQNPLDYLALANCLGAWGLASFAYWPPCPPGGRPHFLPTPKAVWSRTSPMCLTMLPPRDQAQFSMTIDLLSEASPTCVQC